MDSVYVGKSFHHVELPFCFNIDIASLFTGLLKSFRRMWSDFLFLVLSEMHNTFQHSGTTFSDALLTTSGLYRKTRKPRRVPGSSRGCHNSSFWKVFVRRWLHVKQISASRGGHYCRLYNQCLHIEWSIFGWLYFPNHFWSCNLCARKAIRWAIILHGSL